MATSDSESSMPPSDDGESNIFAGMGEIDKDADATGKDAKAAADAAMMPPPTSPTRAKGTCAYLYVCRLMCGVSSIPLVHLFW